MNTLSLAFRNIFRNARRSIMTMMAVGVGALAILMFGGFVSAIVLSFQTFIVQNTGHLHVYKRGYFDFGAGNPSAYGIADYAKVMQAIADDPVLKPMVAVATPSLTLFGIAGNFAANTSKTFFGTGLVPSDRERMRRWNAYGLQGLTWRESAMHDDDRDGGVIGLGLARMLSLCATLNVANCPTPPAAETSDKPVDQDIASLAAAEAPQDNGAGADPRPRIDLLAATAGGAPNVVNLRVARAENQGIKELDDAYVAMHLDLAQRLVFGRGERKVTALILQLHRSGDLKAAQARLETIFRDRGLDLEVRDFSQLTPMYPQVIGMFGTIFGFIAVIMGVIVLFTIANTMSMSVMERINEIGTLRALGQRRSGVRRQFLAEGFLLGLFGATLGVVAAILAAQAMNHSGLSWTPPGNSAPVPLTILLFQSRLLVPAAWICLTVLATLSTLFPANKAARMVVVDALRHV
ncbi:MAG: ABC transporter permease [Ferrovibrionaceae bacterium]